MIPLGGKPTFAKNACMGLLLRLVEEKSLGVWLVETKHCSKLSPAPALRAEGLT